MPTLNMVLLDRWWTITCRLINFKRCTGTLLQYEQINEVEMDEAGLPRLALRRPVAPQAPPPEAAKSQSANPQAPSIQQSTPRFSRRKSPACRLKGLHGLSRLSNRSRFCRHSRRRTRMATTLSLCPPSVGLNSVTGEYST